MNELDSTTEAYQILADLLVSLRRIIHRGLEKVAGKTWYLDGCPPGLFEQLVERKEKEMAIDRFGDEYQELITFASLDDLAAIIEYNSDLAKLLSSLETEGSPMIERLRKIEALRLKMAASVPFDDEDLEMIHRYHREFRDSLTRKKKARDDSTPQPSAPPTPEVSEEAESDSAQKETGTDANGEEDAPEIEAEVKPSPEFSTQAATFEELVGVVGGAKAEDEDESDRWRTVASDDVRTDTPVAPPPDSGSLPLAVEAELAMAEDNDQSVLRVLHLEVTAIAESAFRKVLDVEHPVWDTVRASGWYDMKKADLALAPLELFYTVVARAAEVQRSGAGMEAVKAVLDEAEFSKLLLALREMFLRQSL